MGLGSYFLMINATPWKLIRGNESQHQMNKWDWPAEFAAGVFFFLILSSASSSSYCYGLQDSDNTL